MRTKVLFFTRPDGKLIGYSASGHSGYAEAGSDIVCAGISALTLSVFNGLQNILKVPVMFDRDDEQGYLEVRLTPEATEAQVGQAQVLLLTLYEGLEAIRMSYPRNIRISKERR